MRLPYVERTENHHSAASPNSRRVRIFLAEKGIAIPLVPVDLALVRGRVPAMLPSDNPANAAICGRSPRQRGWLALPSFGLAVVSSVSGI
jgi:hypothetical protein